MGGREGVVDPDVAELCQRRDERRIVLLLALVEARVLQAQDVAGPHCRDRGLGFFADAVRGEGDRPADDVRECRRDRPQRLLRIGRLGPAEMGEQDHLAALRGDLGDGRLNPRDAGRVGDPSVFHRHVEVDAHEHAPAAHVGLIERAEAGHLGANLRTTKMIPVPTDQVVMSINSIWNAVGKLPSLASSPARRPLISAISALTVP